MAYVKKNPKSKEQMCFEVLEKHPNGLSASAIGKALGRSDYDASAFASYGLKLLVKKKKAEKFRVGVNIIYKLRKK